MIYVLERRFSLNHPTLFLIQKTIELVTSMVIFWVCFLLVAYLKALTPVTSNPVINK